MGGTGISPSYVDAWKRLEQSARTDKLTRKEHFDSLREKKGRDLRPRIARIAFALCTVWLLALALWQRTDTPAIRPVPISKSEPPAPVVAVVRSVSRRDIVREGRPVTVRPSTVSTRHSSSARVAEIAWSNGKSSTSEECSLATATVLIDNSAENRARRDRVCAGERPNERRAAD